MPAAGFVPGHAILSRSIANALFSIGIGEKILESSWDSRTTPSRIQPDGKISPHLTLPPARFVDFWRRRNFGLPTDREVDGRWKLAEYTGKSNSCELIVEMPRTQDLRRNSAHPLRKRYTVANDHIFKC
jgi:hypothetical protein